MENYILEVILTAVIATWLGSMEWRLRNVANKQSRLPDRHEVREIIELKQEALRVAQQDIKNDVVRLEHKIDKMIELLVKNG